MRYQQAAMHQRSDEAAQGHKGGDAHVSQQIRADSHQEPEAHRRDVDANETAMHVRERTGFSTRRFVSRGIRKRA